MINSTHSAFDQIRPLRDLCCHLGRLSSSTRPPLQQVFRQRESRARTKLRPRQFSRLWECQLKKEKVFSSRDPEKDFQMSFEQIKNVKLMPVITNERLSQPVESYSWSSRSRSPHGESIDRIWLLLLCIRNHRNRPETADVE